MPTFAYEALDQSGEVRSGEVESANSKAASIKLSQSGYQVLSIKEKHDKKKSAAKKIADATSTKLNDKQLLHFTEELSDMLNADLSIEDSLYSMSNRVSDKSIQKVASNAYKSITTEGETLSSALPKSSESFSGLYCSLVKAGEQTNSVGEILEKQVKHLNSISALKGKVRTALIYPAFLVLSAFAVMLVFALFLLPRLQALIESTGGELPAIATAVAGVTAFVKARWWLVLIVLALLFVLAGVFIKSPAGRLALNRFLLSAPFISPIYKSYFNLHFSQGFANLVSNQINVPDALRLCRNITNNPVLQKRLDIMVDDVVEKGMPVNEAMKNQDDIFEPTLIDMVGVGEKTARLDHSMTKAAIRMERSFDRKIKTLTEIIQPVITIVIALFVGAIAVLIMTILSDTLETIRETQIG